MIGLLLLLLLWAVPGEASIFFDSDFEGTLAADGWSPFNSSSAGQSLAVSTDTSLTGSQSLKGTWTTLSSPGGGGAGATHTFTPSTHFYGRFAFRMMPGFQVGSNAFSKLMRVRGNNEGGYPVLWVYNASGTYGFQLECPYDTSLTQDMLGIYPGTPISTTAWEQIEWEIKLNTPGSANGEIRMWVNGILVVERTGMQLVGPSTGSIGACSARQSSAYKFDFVEIFVQSGIGTAYYDRVAAGDTNIGAVGNPAPDTTPPPQVTGQTVSVSSSSAVLLQWSTVTDNSGTAVTYLIERSPSGCTAFVQIQTTQNLSYTDSGLSASTSYCWRIRARDASGNLGIYSNTLIATTLAATSTTRRELENDPFAIANENPLSNGATWAGSYTGAGALQVVSQGIRGVTLGSVGMSGNTTVLPADQWVEAQLFVYTNGLSGGGPACRMATPATSSGVWVDTNSSNQYVIRERVNGIDRLVKASTVTAVSGDILLLECVGTTATLSRNGTVIAADSSLTLTSGRGGLFLYVATSTANTVLDNFRSGDYVSTPKPVVTNLVCDATGCNLTYGTTTPTTVRRSIWNPWVGVPDVVLPIASLPGGRDTHTWEAGSASVCYFARDAAGVESTNNEDYRCVPLTGLVQNDTTPPGLTCALQGTSPLASNQTSATLLCTSDEVATVRYDTSNIAYSSMATTMTTVNGLSHSASVSVSAGGSYTYYFRGQDQAVPSQNVNTSSQSVAFSVDASGGDTTAPTAMSNLNCTTTSPSAGSCTFTAGTDNTAVTGYECQSSIDNSTFTVVVPNWGTSSPQTIVGLNANTLYYVKCKTLDAAGNRSGFSNTASFTTENNPDLVPPSQLTGLATTANGILYNSVSLTWNVGTDNVGVSQALIERCAGANCTNFTTYSVTGAQALTDSSVLPVSIYRYRGKFRDLAGNVSESYSDILTVTTPDVPAGVILGICPCKRRN